jgi:hypothetical protein
MEDSGQCIYHTASIIESNVKIIILLIILSLFSLPPAHSQPNIPLDKSIQETLDYLDTRLPAHSVVAVLNIKSDNQALSNRIIDKLLNAMIDRANFSAIDREHIDFIQKELQFHLSGDVSDETAQSIGKILGAQTIISGEVIRINNKMYQLAIKAISVETAALQGTVSKNFQNDKEIKTITGDTETFPISIGGGIHIGGSFTSGTLEEKGKENLDIDQTIFATNYISATKDSKSELDIGAFMFFDLKYAEINISLFNGMGKSRLSRNKDYYFLNKLIHTENPPDVIGNFSTLLLDIGLLAKYPFYLNNIALYPLLGADYQFWLLSTENKKTVPGDLSANNALWLKAGGGIDCHLTRSLFLRAELLWSAKLPSKTERADSFTWFTHSPTVRIGMGYVFNR